MFAIKKMSKILATGVITAAVICSSAFAAGSVTATTDVNIRSGPGTSYSVVRVLPKGATAEKLGTSGKWVNVKYKDSKGYVSEKYVKDTTEAAKTTTVYTTANLNVRSAPNTSSKILGTLKKGTAVKTYALKDGWYQIKYDGKTAYISAKYTSTTDPAKPAEKVTTVYTTANLNVRSAPNTSSKILGTLKKGTAVKTYALKDGWYQIKYDGKTAYISAKYTSKTAPAKEK